MGPRLTIGAFLLCIFAGGLAMAGTKTPDAAADANLHTDPHGDVRWLYTPDVQGTTILACKTQTAALRTRDSGTYEVHFDATPGTATAGGMTEPNCTYKIHVRRAGWLRQLAKDILSLEGVDGATKDAGYEAFQETELSIGIISLMPGSDQLLISEGGCGGSCSRPFDQIFSFEGGRPVVMLGFFEEGPNEGFGDYHDRMNTDWAIHDRKLTLTGSSHWGDKITNPPSVGLTFDPATMKPNISGPPESFAFYEKVIQPPDWYGRPSSDQDGRPVAQLPAPYNERHAPPLAAAEQNDTSYFPEPKHKPSREELEQQIDHLDETLRRQTEARCAALPSNYYKIFNLPECDAIRERNNLLIYGSIALWVIASLGAVLFIRRRAGRSP